jgi:alpha-N-arabinofuranosidase
MKTKRLLASAFLVWASSTALSQETIIEIGPPTEEIISRHIYGQFAEHLGRCIYDGFYRNGQIRMDIVEALKQIRIPLLRWPGGCFADNYHWRDGIGPLAKRAKTVNVMWGMVAEDNSFGTGEFLQLCQLIGCEPYMAGNMGTGSPEELESWVEYLNFQGPSDLSNLRSFNGHPTPYHVKYWGIGNESWGCGGRMTPETYAARYRTFANYVREYPGSPVARIASGAQDDDYNWTEYLMSHISSRWLQGIGVHYYTDAGGRTENFATAFGNAQYFGSLKSALRMERIIAGHASIMDRYDPGKKVALIIDEWGMVVGDENSQSYFYQQNSLRDALAAASTLNIFNNHCDRVKMANLAQAVNVLQSLVLTSGDSMVLTPTYYVFDLDKVHQDARWLPIRFSSMPYYVHDKDSIVAVNASASLDSNNKIHVSLVNLDPVKQIPIILTLEKKTLAKVVGQVLTGAGYTDINTFSTPDRIKIRPFSRFKQEEKGLSVNMPPMSVVVLEIAY